MSDNDTLFLASAGAVPDAAGAAAGASRRLAGAGVRRNVDPGTVNHPDAAPAGRQFSFGDGGDVPGPLGAGHRLCLQGCCPAICASPATLSERRSCGSLFARRMAWPSMVILARTGCFLSMPSMTRAAGWRICAAMPLLLRRRTPARCAPGCWRIAICCFVRRLAGLPPRG